MIGYAIHFANGLLFSLAYGLVFQATGGASWLFGLLLGAAHGAFAGGRPPQRAPAVGPSADGQAVDRLALGSGAPGPGLPALELRPRDARSDLRAHLVYGAIVEAFAEL